MPIQVSIESFMPMKHLHQLNFWSKSSILTLIYLLITRSISSSKNRLNNCINSSSKINCITCISNISSSIPSRMRKNKKVNCISSRIPGRQNLYLNQFILYTLLILLINLIIEQSILFVDALGPRCKCIRYLDTYGKEFGTFTSPNWPSPYEDSIDCILYTFQGESDQLVEITFDEFDLQRTNIDCVYGDFIKLYLHLEDGQGINEESPFNDVLCGKLADIEQTHYSSGSTLIFEFHTDWRSGNNTGFRGSYRFLSKKLFETDGILLPNSKCDYKFDSFTTTTTGTSIGNNNSIVLNGLSSSSSVSSSLSHSSSPMSVYSASPAASSPSTNSAASTGNRLTSASTAGASASLVRSNKGRFYSPQYPSTYPKGIKCSYAFNGQSNQRIRLIFEHIMLLKDDLSCLTSPDVILVYDGIDSTAPIIGQYCNTKAFVELVSTRENVFVEFYSRSHFPGQGFKGRFSFEEITAYPNGHPSHSDSSSPSSSSSSSWSGASYSHYAPSAPYSIFSFSHNPSSSASASASSFPSSSASSSSSSSLGSSSLHGQNKGDLDNGLENCDINFSSDTGKNGTFSSPGYPHSYPPGINCVYQFFASGKERIQILFTDFDLHIPSETDLPNLNQNPTPNRDCEGIDTVMVFVVTNGNKVRIDNFCGTEIPAQLMSNGPSLRVEFKSMHPLVSHNSQGFKAIYRFVTNFGITSGIQDEKLGACAFVYNSTISPNGTFTSPNWPGLYPRDTECHYFFYGQPQEKVHITFAYFDIEGVSPCTMETSSDYVEFSNYKSIDRKIPRHCGLKKPKTIESEGDFFRVTFKSNDRFDGTGFEAFFQFRNPKDGFAVKKLRGTLSASSTSTSTSISSSSQIQSNLFYSSLFIMIFFTLWTSNGT